MTADAVAGSIEPRERLGAAGLVVVSALSAQLGAAFAFRLFTLTSPFAVAWIRNLVGAIVLAALLALRGGSLKGVNLMPAAALGLILGTMNTSFYEGIARLPLGDAVSVEFMGPIAVAAIASAHRRDLVWVALATVGVLAISRPGPDHLNYLGLAFIALAAICWALYIIVGRRVATGGRRADTLVAAMAISAVYLLAPAVLRSGATLIDVRVLALAAVVGVLSSAIPYSVELMALQRVPPSIFGVLLSLQPLMAGLMGLMVLGQRVSALEVVGFALVVAASIGVTLGAPPRKTPIETPMAAS